MKNTQVYFAIAVLVSILAAAGCQKQDPASVVQRRALERWNLLITHQPVKAYDYLSPGYRATHTLDQYVAFIGTARLKWKEAKVDSQKCDADTCTVSLMVKSDIPGQMINAPRDIEHEAPVFEHWIASDGQWYFLPDSRIEPTSVSANEQAPTSQSRSPAASNPPPSRDPGPPPATPPQNGH